MPSRLQRFVSYGIPSTAAATIVAAALLSPWVRPAGPPEAEPLVTPVPATPSESGKHQVDVVFAVDTTHSMNDLLHGAKSTVWSIAEHIRRTDPQASLRIGLVAFRDVGDDYVTKPFALTHDLDAVYAELLGYSAGGGGDAPEDVDAALYDALKMRWRAGAKKLIFVVGDAPPASRGEVPRFDVLAREAAVAGIKVNAIRCGDDLRTERAFRELASLGGGEFSTIAQDGGVQRVATPYDAELAALSSRIDRTTVIVGDEGERARYEAKMVAADAAPAPAKADRAGYYARKAMATKGGADVRSDGDLVGMYETGSVEIGLVAPGSLPADLRGKTAAELTREIAARSEARKQAQAKIAELSRKRDAFLTEANKAAGTGGFDAAVKATVEKQLK